MASQNRTLRQRILATINPASIFRPKVPFFWRFVLVLVAWYLALCMIPRDGPGWLNPMALPILSCIFPIGLVAILGLPVKQELLPLAYLLYITVVAALLLTPRRTPFWLVYLGFLILLALNVQGCQTMKLPGH